MTLRQCGSSFQATLYPLLRNICRKDWASLVSKPSSSQHLRVLLRQRQPNRRQLAALRNAPAQAAATPIVHAGARTGVPPLAMGLHPTAEEGLEEAVGDGVWHALGAPPQELQLDFCLPTGQSFRWRRTGDNEYTGVIGDRLVCLVQLPDDVRYRVLARGRDASSADDAAVLRDYFNLDTRLSQLATGWAASCSRFRDVSPHFPGARMLRQDPLECLFQFICSSNNHISRIHGMVERLCSSYGTPLEPTTAVAGQGHAQPPAASATGPGVGPGGSPGAAPKAKRKRGGKGAAATAAGDGGAAAAAPAAPAAAVLAGGHDNGLSYYAFPTLEQLGRATEEELRAAGFGYRARFIVGTTRALAAKPGGGREWLLGLRRVGLEEAVQALTELPGIGPKVAACICLFSLDKHSAIPVDTHVWQIAVRHYCPQLRGRSLTKAVHGEVQRVFVERFGPYAGWAHNTLFISELASQQHRLPENLRQAKEKAKEKGKEKGKAAAIGGGKRRGRTQGPVGGDSDSDSDSDADAEEEPGARSDGEDGDSDGGGGGGGVKKGERAAARRRPRGGGAAAAPAAAATAAVPGPGGNRRGGAGRGRQPARGAAAAATVELTTAAVGAAAATETAAAAAPVGSVAVTGSSGSSQGPGAAAGPACAAAVVEGQADADLGSAPAPARAAGRLRGRGAAAAAAAARGPEPEPEPAAPGAGRNKKRAAGKARDVPAAKAKAQAAGDYELNEFDDLAT
ncbi:hypothetical protein PLESTB_000809200 [Pleodorina starrii]|uniref:DNA-(apurinic or apyrimidinic site) lyase n=1 Tax=Pleodorina starrii TaxID=330485 RepID=A0A9W6BL88_9CHLO|nr:hypothetical protein PLESTM_000915500 [Pleodorina starrii]GLC53963.1 hypothetical protein PLESTB_000809200 [Pleodorina starrii]GLC70245.1 hypothetical protein PLESTF_000947800 [Pleodorina starrii]